MTRESGHRTYRRHANKNANGGRAWLTVDGEEIANFCTRARSNRLFEEMLIDRGSPPDPRDEEPDVPFGYGELSREDAYAARWAFADDLSIGQALADSDPLVQALAVLDSRLGKRRLSRLDATSMHPLAGKMLLLRLKTEGLHEDAEPFVDAASSRVDQSGETPLLR